MDLSQCPREWEFVQSSLRRRLWDDEETRDRALSYIWYRCLRRDKLPPLVPLIHRAVQSVQSGRDLPGCGLIARRDVMTRFSRVAMGQGRSRGKAGLDVAQLAASREHWERFVARCRGRQHDVVIEFARDWNVTAKKVAETIGTTPMYVSRVRRQLVALAAQE